MVFPYCVNTAIEVGIMSLDGGEILLLSDERVSTLFTQYWYRHGNITDSGQLVGHSGRKTECFARVGLIGHCIGFYILSLLRYWPKTFASDGYALRPIGT